MQDINKTINEIADSKKLLHDAIGILMVKYDIATALTAYFAEMGTIYDWAEDQLGESAATEAISHSLNLILESRGFEVIIVKKE